MGTELTGPLADTLDDLHGLTWIPGMNQILAGIREAATASQNGRLALDATQTLLATLGNPDNPDLPGLLALLAQHLTNPSTNPALTSLDDDTQKTVQRLGELHVYETAEYAPREQTNEAAALIDEAAAQREGGEPAMTRLDDEQRKELSDKVRKVNKQSTNRPR